jgi:protein-disulfide isomerase
MVSPSQLRFLRAAMSAGVLVVVSLIGCQSSDPARNGTTPGSSPRAAAPVGETRSAGAPAAASSSVDTARQVAAQPSDGARRPNGPMADSAVQRLLQRSDRGRIQGDASAPVWVIVASDFQCPFCRAWHAETYPTLVRDYVKTGKIRMAFLNYPLNIHKNAWPAAEAAMCASIQGMFWEMHDAIFSLQERWSTIPGPAALQLFDSLAVNKFSLRPDEYRACMSSHETAALVQADFERLRTAGVEQTPSFFIGDRGIAGAQPTDVFRAAIEQALAKARGTAAPKPRR